jgi:hypothetical protein
LGYLRILVKYQLAASGHLFSLFPSCPNEAIAGNLAFNFLGINVGIKPFTWPPLPSYGHSRLYQVAAALRAFVAKHGTINPGLSAVIYELPPHKEGFTVGRKQDQLLR